MCTVSWLRMGGRVELFSNRDERRSRGAAEPPRVFVNAGVRYISPVDADAGGTWIAANEFGLAFCLLNKWPARSRETTPRSRGLVILKLVDCRTPDEVRSRFEGMRLEPFAPFSLLAVEDADSALLFEWDGRTKNVGSARDGLLTSSSFEPASVAERRRGEYRRLLETAGLCPVTLGMFHASHADGPSAFSVCMHRHDARTVSHTRLVLDRDAVTFRYWPDAPCRGGSPRTVAIPRRAS